jgi:hypothetical protein
MEKSIGRFPRFVAWAVEADSSGDGSRRWATVTTRNLPCAHRGNPIWPLHVFGHGVAVGRENLKWR